MFAIGKKYTDLHIPQTHKFAGFYTIKKYKADTNELVQEIGPFKNDITNIGLNRAGTGNPFSYIYVGTGTSAPSVLDTSMASFLAATNASPTNTLTRTTSAPYWVQQTQTRRFGAGVAAGNLTEVGIGWTNNSVNGLWSRALIVDALGNPVTLVVLADEYLDVTYTLRYYPPLDDVVTNFTISGAAYTATARVAYVTSIAVEFAQVPQQLYTVAYGGNPSLGTVTGNITGYTGQASLNSAGAQPYLANSFKTTFSSTSGLDSGNVAGGIKAIYVYGTGGTLWSPNTQMLLNTAIPKNSTKILTLNFEHSWSRYTP